MSFINKKDGIEYDSKDLEIVERQFLNTGMFHSVSAACFKIQNDFMEKHYYGNFYISDCARTVDLDLDLDTMEGLENSIHKLTVLKEVCEKGIEHLNKMKLHAHSKLKKKDESNKKEDLHSNESVSE